MTKKRGTSRVSLDRSVQITMRLEKTAAAIVAQARRDSLTFDRMLEMRSEQIYGSADWQRIPSYARAQIDAAFRGAWTVMEMTAVRWQHYVDGVRLDSLEISRRDLYARVKSRHEWAHNGEPWREADRNDPAFLKGNCKRCGEDLDCHGAKIRGAHHC